MLGWKIWGILYFYFMKKWHLFQLHSGVQDLGYGSSAKTLGQAATCLVQDISKDEVQGGFWTPANIFSLILVTCLAYRVGLIN